MQIISSHFLAFYFSTVFVLFWDGGQQQLVFLQTRIYKSLKYDLDSESIRTDSRNKWEEKKVSESEISSFCKLPCDYAKLFSYVFCQTKYLDSLLAFWRGYAVHVRKFCFPWIKIRPYRVGKLHLAGVSRLAAQNWAWIHSTLLVSVARQHETGLVCFLVCNSLCKCQPN